MSSAITAAVASVVVSDALSDDNGASSANGAAADANRLQAQISREQWNKYKEIYEPMERKFVAESTNYDTPLNYAKAAGEASATVSQQFSKARDRLTRTPGMDPSSAAYQAGIIGLDMAQAANEATAQNTARQTVKDTAYGRKLTAIGLGKGLDSTAAAGLATSASQNLARAQSAQAQANAEASALGNVTQRVVGALPGVTSNWLGSGSQAGYALGTTSVSPQAVSSANQTSDPLGSLAASQGWLN